MLWLLMALSYWGLQTPSAQPTSLIVEVDGHRDSHGEIHVGLFQTAEGFPNSEYASHGGVVPITSPGPIRFQINQLPPGTYALAVFQDLNGNGILDTNILGIPTEPYGFSNAVRAKWRKPTFTDAAIQFRYNRQVERVRLYDWTSR